MDLLIITGAGSSRELGAEDRMPLMGDWARALRRELNRREEKLADAAGLSDELDATAFEETIGALLRWQDVRPLAERFRALGGPQAGAYSSEVPVSYERETARLTEVVSAINVTLYELFGADKIDDAAATDAYGQLLKAADANGLWFATTNYDPAIEIALQGLGYTPATGFPPLAGGRAPVLSVDGLAGQADGKVVPVVHLHGAVGWYEQRNVVRQTPTNEGFDPTRGQPVILHPDPDKDPTQHAIVSDLWREFEAMLDAATHVLVLGHSLHDPALLNKLAAASKSLNTAVTFFPEDADGQAFIGKQYKRLQGPAATIPAVFGPSGISKLEKVIDWLRCGGSSGLPQ